MAEEKSLDNILAEEVKNIETNVIDPIVKEQVSGMATFIISPEPDQDGLATTAQTRMVWLL